VCSTAVAAEAWTITSLRAQDTVLHWAFGSLWMISAVGPLREQACIGGEKAACADFIPCRMLAGMRRLGRFKPFAPHDPVVTWLDRCSSELPGAVGDS